MARSYGERILALFCTSIMLTNYLKIALRTLRKHPGYTFINITGLAVGLACCLLILLFVRDELQYDRFHEKADRIYRVRLEALLGEQAIEGPIAPAPMAATLVRDYPEVQQATRLFSFYDEALVRHDDVQFIEHRLLFADSTFFDVFTVPLLQGNPATALAEPNTVVLSASAARRYFGAADPMGQTLRLDDRTDYQVTGVAVDMPAQSHFHFDLLGSLESLDDSRNTLWVSNNFHTYLVLPEGYNPDALETKFPALVRKYAGPQVEEALGITVDQFYASGGRYEYHLQPLTNIHLYSQYDYEIEPNGDIAYVYAFSAVALLILLIACINFMNLATARSAGRAKEVGIRKVLGSDRRQLTGQFLLESLLLSGVAMLLALVLMAAFLPVFNALAGKNLHMDVLDGVFLPGLLALTLLVGVLAGSYPAFFLASFRIVHVLKGKLAAGASHSGLRSSLVVFQFAISITLMIGTAVVYRQVSYVQNTHLGFDKDHVVMIERAYALGEQQNAFTQQVEQVPGVASVAAISNVPGRDYGDSSFLPEGAPGDELYSLRLTRMDYDAIETLGLEMVAGRTFSPDHPSDSSAIILNEAAVREMGWQDDAVGRRLVSPNFDEEPDVYTVVGVVKNFHFQSLHQQIRPLGIFLGRNLQYLAVRVRPNAVPATLAELEATWQTLVPEQPFTFSFLDDNVNALYQNDQRTGQLFGAFALLAIGIACLGLFGLAAFMAEQRTKEIGVRKALGATIPNILVLLTKDFVRLVLIALVLAMPAAYVAMQRWLDDFAYHIEISGWIFLIAGLTALGIALLTVSYQSIKAARTDPVKSLRYE